MRKAIFLDRDGTIIVDGNYISKPEQVAVIPGAAEALAMLRDAQFDLFLLTNQSGVGRGMFSLDSVHSCNRRMLELINLGPTLFTEICIAPESPDQQIIYRKPSPRFINEAVMKYGLDRTRCWMVGDKAIDVAAGLNAGIRAASVGAIAPTVTTEVEHYPSLLKFAQHILADRDVPPPIAKLPG